MTSEHDRPTTAAPGRVRADGIEVREATEDDLDQVSDLLERRGEPADAVDLRLVAADPDEGLRSVLVAVDDGRVVSTATLLSERVRVGEVVLPAAQVEMVATEPSHEGRGLVRSLMDAAHARSRARGDVLQVMIGIAFFYRQFGYVYSMPIPHTRTLASVPSPVAGSAGITVREATTADIPSMEALQHAVQSQVDVAMAHSPGCWRWLLGRDGSSQWVAEQGGRVVGTARLTPPDEGVYVGELAGDATAVHALLRHAAELAGDGAAVEVMDRPGTDVQPVLDPLLAPVDDDEADRSWFYARVEDPVLLFEALRPELGRRWVAAGGDPQEVLISSYRSHVRFHLGPDGMGPVTGGGALQAPISAGGSGVPHDVLAPLVLGPFGARGLERRHADVMLGRQREVMSVLFPPQRADLLTFYLPV